MIFNVTIDRDEDGVFVVECPSIPGCVSQGETMEDVRTNVREAIQGWLLADEGAAHTGAADPVLEVTV